MNALLIAATVAIISTVPAPQSDGAVRFHKSELVITFDQPVVTHKIEVLDADECKISQDMAVDGAEVVIKLKACSVGGFPPGHMHIYWKVNGVDGHNHLHVSKHH